MKSFLSTIILFISIASSCVLADDFVMYRPADDSTSGEAACTDSEQGCPGKWAASAEFGYVAVSGNQDTSSINGRFALSYEIEKWRHAGFIASHTSSSEDAVTGDETKAEKYTFQAKSDYKYSEQAYAFGIVDYDNTRDSGFEYQASYALGIGYRFLNDDKHTLDGELGFGSRESKAELTGLTTSEAITRLAGLYQWKINENSSFEQKLSSEIGDDNTISKSYTGLSANVMEKLALKVSYELKHQSEVPVGNEKRETITSFTLVYSF